MPKILRRTQFGNPILRTPAAPLSSKEIISSTIKQLIANMRYTLKNRKYGVGLAAPQIGVSKALSIIGIKPTPTRPDAEHFESVIINPTYEGIGRRSSMWEGCISFGVGSATPFAKALRYRTIKASWVDERGIKHNEVLKGFVAHVFQHETDHLKGILFVDKVQDSSTWMNASEYRKRIAKPRHKARSQTSQTN